MINSLSNSDSASNSSKTLWIGDVEAWMDENYISSLFNGVSISLLIIIDSICTICQVNKR